ncbi:unnamed protein product [Amoebophrya sp. A120]|nr:unnamed protein product [Amoebophrya sp. A120]|eukprot:GSA120T00017282001.1
MSARHGGGSSGGGSDDDEYNDRRGPGAGAVPPAGASSMADRSSHQQPGDRERSEDDGNGSNIEMEVIDDDAPEIEQEHEDIAAGDDAGGDHDAEDGLADDADDDLDIEGEDESGEEEEEASASVSEGADDDAGMDDEDDDGDSDESEEEESSAEESDEEDEENENDQQDPERSENSDPSPVRHRGKNAPEITRQGGGADLVPPRAPGMSGGVGGAGEKQKLPPSSKDRSAPHNSSSQLQVPAHQPVKNQLHIAPAVVPQQKKIEPQGGLGLSSVSSSRAVSPATLQQGAKMIVPPKLALPKPPTREESSSSSSARSAVAAVLRPGNTALSSGANYAQDGVRIGSPTDFSAGSTAAFGAAASSSSTSTASNIFGRLWGWVKSTAGSVFKRSKEERDAVAVEEELAREREERQRRGSTTGAANETSARVPAVPPNSKVTNVPADKLDVRDEGDDVVMEDAGVIRLEQVEADVAGNEKQAEQVDEEGKEKSSPSAKKRRISKEDNAIASAAAIQQGDKVVPRRKSGASPPMKSKSPTSKKSKDSSHSMKSKSPAGGKKTSTGSVEHDQQPPVKAPSLVSKSHLVVPSAPPAEQNLRASSGSSSPKLAANMTGSKRPPSNPYLTKPDETIEKLQKATGTPRTPHRCSVPPNPFKNRLLHHSASPSKHQRKIEAKKYFSPSASQGAQPRRRVSLSDGPNSGGASPKRTVTIRLCKRADRMVTDPTDGGNKSSSSSGVAFSFNENNEKVQIDKPAKTIATGASASPKINPASSSTTTVLLGTRTFRKDERIFHLYDWARQFTEDDDFDLRTATKDHEEDESLNQKVLIDDIDSVTLAGVGLDGEKSYDLKVVTLAEIEAEGGTTAGAENAEPWSKVWI